MPRVAAAQVLAHLLVGAAPEAGQIARDRGRPARWGEQLHGDGQPPVQHRGCACRSEQFLQLHGQHGFAAAVVQGCLAAGGDRDRGRQQRVQLSPCLPGQAAPQGLDQIQALQVLAAAYRIELFAQPVLRIGGQGGVAAVGPWIPQLPVRQAEPLLQLPAPPLPGQGLQPQLLQARQHSRAACLGGCVRPGAALQHQRPQPQFPFGPHPLLLVIPAHLRLLLPVQPGQFRQAAARQRQRQLDAGVAVASIRLGDRQRHTAQ